MSDSKRRLRPSPSLIISIFALVIAMSAGAYAVTIAPKNSVVSKSIKNKNVKTKDLANLAVSNGKLKDNAVNANKIQDGSVGTNDIGDGQVGSADIGDGQVGLNDLSTAAKTDLNDATTVGGLTVAQIVAASGGEYIEANQAGTANVEVLPANDTLLASIDLPHAGKWLISAHVPVTCTWDNTPAGGDPDPANGSATDQPWFYGMARLKQGATVLQSETESCEAEAGQAIVIVGITVGTATIDMTRLVTVTGPTTLTLEASSAPSNVLGVDVIASSRVDATANGSKLMAITVQ
jgi:hypothetical protein